MKKILYIVNRIPSRSHTFIDREIKSLSGAGYDLKLVSRGSPIEEEVSAKDIYQYRHTLYLDKACLFLLLWSQFEVIFHSFLAHLNNIRLIIIEKEIKGFRDRLRLFKHLLEAGYIYSRMRKINISHIHAHFLNAPTSMALFLSRYLNISYSFTLHGSNIFLDPLMLGTKLKFSRNAVTVSEYNKKFLLKKYGIYLSKKIHIIRCGIDTSLFKPTINKKNVCPIVLGVGRLIKLKGFSYLLDACQILKKKGIVFKCFLIGDGEERSNLIIKSNSLGIDDIITFLGAQPQNRVHTLLMKANIFVLPCIINDQGGRDGIPVAIMEAMSMGLPVVSTQIVGIPELIENGKDGMLVQQKNPPELASAIESLIRNPNLCYELGKRARLKIIRKFNIANTPYYFNKIFL